MKEGVRMKGHFRWIFVFILISLIGIISILLHSGSEISPGLPETVRTQAGGREPVGRNEKPAGAEPASPREETAPAMGAIREYAERMDRFLDSTRTVGAAFTIVHDGQVVVTGTHGVRRKGSNAKVNSHTVFRLASVSKGFSGALACLLEHDGLLTLDDKVVTYLPGFRLKDSASTAELTIRHILSHTSGLVPHAYDNLVEADEPLGDIIERLDEVDISAAPGSLYGYQNVVFSMLAPIAEQVSGISFAQLMEDKIFGPLGMDDASAGRIDLGHSYNVAYPHVRGKNGFIPLDLHEGYYNVLPAAGINASIDDMGQWLLALLGMRPDIFPDTVRRQLETPVIYTPLKAVYTRAWGPVSERHYSLGWRIYQYRGRKIVYHGGYVRGYRAEIAFCPEEKTGIAFLQNSPNGLASESVPGFFDHFFQYMDSGGQEKMIP